MAAVLLGIIKAQSVFIAAAFANRFTRLTQEDEHRWDTYRKMGIALTLAAAAAYAHVTWQATSREPPPPEQDQPAEQDSQQPY